MLDNTRRSYLQHLEELVSNMNESTTDFEFEITVRDHGNYAVEMIGTGDNGYHETIIKPHQLPIVTAEARGLIAGLEISRMVLINEMVRAEILETPQEVKE